MADKAPEPTAMDEHPDRDPRALPADAPDAPGEGREVIVPAPVTGGMALGGPVVPGVTPEVTEDQAKEDKKTAGGTKGTKAP